MSENLPAQTHFELQPLLNNDLIDLQPLQESDFEKLYIVASDPLIWEQHPNKDRYKREVFEIYFKGAIESGGAFLIYDAKNMKPIGSTRFYEWNKAKRTLAIGYTFLSREYWGTTHNRALKTLMLDHALKFADKVIFHIGANNIRSQKAITKLGAKKTGEIEMAYYGEEKKLDFVYEIEKENWLSRSITEVSK